MQTRHIPSHQSITDLHTIRELRIFALSDRLLKTYICWHQHVFTRPIHYIRSAFHILKQRRLCVSLNQVILV